MTSPFQESESPANSCGTPLKLAALRRTPRLNDGAPDDKRKEIALYFTNTFDTYTRLFECLADDAGHYQKSIPLRASAHFLSRSYRDFFRQ